MSVMLCSLCAENVSYNLHSSAVCYVVCMFARIAMSVVCDVLSDRE